MPIDASIYFQRQPLDIVGSIGRGLEAREMLDARSERKAQAEKRDAIKKAYFESTRTGPKGVDIDRKALASNLMGIDPQMGFEHVQRMNKMDREQQDFDYKKKIQDMDLGARIFSAPTDQASWSMALRQAQRGGLDVSGINETYSPELQKSIVGRALSYGDRLKYEAQAQGLDLRERELEQRKDLKEQEFGLRRSEMAQRRDAAKEKARGQFKQDIRKQEAKTYAEMQEKAQAIPANIDLIDRGVQQLVDFNKSKLGGTGPFSTLFGAEKYLSPEAAALDATFKTIDIKNMVTTFKGQAKAIDSDAERAAWRKTQPAIDNDDPVNFQILLGQKSILLKDQLEARARQMWLKHNDDLDNYESPVYGKMETLVNPQSGKMELVPKSAKEELLGQGFLTVDQYADKASSFLGGGLQKAKKDFGAAPQLNEVPDYDESEIEW